MTKSPLALARIALATGKIALLPYSSKFSRHDFTQHQLFALLSLREFLKVDYRGREAILRDWAEQVEEKVYLNRLISEQNRTEKDLREARYRAWEKQEGEFAQFKDHDYNRTFWTDGCYGKQGGPAGTAYRHSGTDADCKNRARAEKFPFPDEYISTDNRQNCGTFNSGSKFECTRPDAVIVIAPWPVHFIS